MGSDNGQKTAAKIGANGLPEFTEEEKQNGFSTFKILLFVMAPLVIGTLVAAGLLHAMRTSAALKAVEVVISHDVHWLYLAAVVFGRLVSFLNFYPMVYKQAVLRMKDGNLRANMIFFKHLGPSDANQSYIGMVDEGLVGRYNRANRSLNHFVENSISVAVSMVLAGVCFPKASCLLAVMFAAGRVMHQVGYSGPVGYGKHGLGFFLSTIASASLEGLLALVVLKGFDVVWF